MARRGKKGAAAAKGRAEHDRRNAEQGPVAPIEQPEEEPTPDCGAPAASPAGGASPFSGRTESEKWALKHWKRSWAGHLKAASPPDSDEEQSPRDGARQERSCLPWSSLGGGRALLETELRVRDASEAMEEPARKPGTADEETALEMSTMVWLPRWLVSIGNNIVSAPCCACQSRAGS